MFFCLPSELDPEVAEVESLPLKHNSWPERELARPTRLAADSPELSKRFSDFRMIVLDVEDLVHTSRWAIGNALLIIRAFPGISAPITEAGSQFSHLGIPARVRLLLSGLLAGRERVIYRDLLERHAGGSRVGVWMVRVLTDLAVTSSISVLDRLSQLLVLAANVTPPRNRMYFRDGKLRVLRAAGVKISDELITLAAGEEIEFLLSYRDGLAHTVRLNATALGNFAVDRYVDDSGNAQATRTASWSSEELVGIGLMSVELVRAAADQVGQHCETFMSDSGSGA